MRRSWLTQRRDRPVRRGGAFGLGLQRIIPAYVLAVRELFPAREAAWRVPMLLLRSGFGMASGGWVAGAALRSLRLYAPAFAAGIGINAVQFTIIGILVWRHRRTWPRPDGVEAGVHTYALRGVTARRNPTP